MNIFINCLAILILFGLLGLTAEFAVRNIKCLGVIQRLKMFAVGILVGIITSFPELFIGLNAMFNNVSTISVGNLLGGIPVLFGLVLGVGIILNKKIATDGKEKSILPEVVVIFSPILLGINGRYGMWEGLILVGLYLGTIYYIIQGNLKRASKLTAKQETQQTISTIKSLSRAVIGIVFVVIISHLILKLTMNLLNHFKISHLLLGAVIFSIGTNLPELTITIVSWYKKMPDLSLSNLIGSALTNVLLLGVFALIQPIEFATDFSFIVLGVFIAIMLILLLVFYRSKDKMETREGLVLLGVYILFLIVNFMIIRAQALADFVGF